MRTIKKILTFSLFASIFVACNSVGSHESEEKPNYQINLENAQILKRNLSGLINNYKLNKSKVGILCTDSIRNKLKIENGVVKLNVIDINSLNKFDKKYKNPNFIPKKSPDVFYYCTNNNKSFQFAMRAYNVINDSDTIWEKTMQKSTGLKYWLPTLDNWSGKFWDENVAIFYPLNDRSKYPKVGKETFDSGVISGFMILVDWANLSLICTVPCAATNSENIKFTYSAGTENLRAYEKLKNDLISNLEKNLISQFNGMGFNEVDSVKLHY